VVGIRHVRRFCLRIHDVLVRERTFRIISIPALAAFLYTGLCFAVLVLGPSFIVLLAVAYGISLFLPIGWWSFVMKAAIVLALPSGVFIWIIIHGDADT
jgi:hypothetical protein